MPFANSLAGIITSLFSGVTLVVVLTATWNLATKLAVITTKLESLMAVLARVAALELDLARLRKDVDHLWAAFREIHAETDGAGS